MAYAPRSIMQVPACTAEYAIHCTVPFVAHEEVKLMLGHHFERQALQPKQVPQHFNSDSLSRN